MTVLTDELKQQYQNYDQKQLNEAFINACQDGYTNIVKYLLTSPDLKQHADINVNNDYAFRIACGHGHLDIVKYLLTSPDLHDHADIHIIDDCGFQWACEEGHLEVVKYLLSSPDLTEHANIHVRNDYSFRHACQNGHLDVVKYLATFSGVTTPISKSVKNIGYIGASYSNYIEIVQYLLTSPDLQEHADIHAKDNQAFILACQNKYTEIIKYLLSFNNEHYINFQNTKFNLHWAMNEQYHEIVKAMMKSVRHNDFLLYIENLLVVEDYCKNNFLNFQEWKVEIEKTHLGNNVQEIFLYL